MTGLRVPDLPDGCDTLSAALAYAEHGWYVGPCDQRTKHPGSVLGKRWQEQTTRDPEQIVAWFAGTDLGLFVHVGRSGGLVLDVDDYSRLPDVARDAIDALQPPFQSTRSDDPRRGHYVFAQATGRMIGNGAGSLGKGWGEVRGRNGVVIVEPTQHEKRDSHGARYSWQRTGPVPHSEPLCDALPDAADSADPATDAAVEAFLAEHTEAIRPALLQPVLHKFDADVAAGGARHDALRDCSLWAAREARAGLYSAGAARDALWSRFHAAMLAKPTADRFPASEFRGVFAWAVAQALQDDTEARRREVEQRLDDDGVDFMAKRPAPAVVDPAPCSLEHLDKTYLRWLGDSYDLAALHAALAAAAVEQLGGDPVWLLIVSGSGAAKTETVAPLAGAGAFVTSTITSEGALLSATPKKDATKDATGGLLRKIGSHGLLVIKDFTSILSMNRDQRAAVLAALREVYDGRWERNVGTDGGKTLTWEGRLVVIGAVTTAYDSAHAVIASMGDRFALVRIDSTVGRRASGLQALRNVDHEVQMRAELAEVTGGLLRSLQPALAVLTEDDMDELLSAADLVTLARTAVERDYQGKVVEAHAPEMPTRFAKMLGQIVRGGLALGMGHGEVLSLAHRVASDSMPPLRLLVLGDVAAHPGSITNEVTKRVQKPRSTVDRVLQELHLLGLLTVADTPSSGLAADRLWRYALSSDVDPEALARLVTRNVSTPGVRVKEGAASPALPTDIPGDSPPATAPTTAVASEDDSDAPF